MNPDSLPSRLRDQCAKIRTRAVPLSDLIPLMQQAADELERAAHPSAALQGAQPVQAEHRPSQEWYANMIAATLDDDFTIGHHATAAQPIYWQHRKTGGVYRLVGHAQLQTDSPLVDMANVTVYQGEDGKLWARAAGECASRFDRVAGPLEQPQEPTSDKANLAQASGVCDLQTALPRWEPIGTRPMDGTRYLAICGTGLIRLVRQADIDDRLPIAADVPGGMWPDLPTHWMPLPLPPGESAGSAGSNKPAASSESSVSVPKEQHNGILGLLGKCECEHCKPAASGEQQ